MVVICPTEARSRSTLPPSGGSVCRSRNARNRGWLSLLLALASPLLLTGLNLPRKLAQPGVSAEAVAGTQLADEKNAIDWLADGRTYDGKRFSPIDQISFADISDLKVDWFTALPVGGLPVSNPLVAGGVLYFNDSDRVTAVDAKTGKVLWTYGSRVAKQAVDQLGHEGRGIALWKGRVYLATAQGRLVAIDAKSGREAWSLNTYVAGEPLHTVGIPITFHGKVLIGNAAGRGVKARGYVTAYDAETGAQAWRFYTPPADQRQSATSKVQGVATRTGTEDSPQLPAANQPSGESVYDPVFNAIYVATADDTVTSIVALDADTGQSRWRYETPPAHSGDLAGGISMILADLEIKGRQVKALMQVPGDGTFCVIDRDSGKVISAQPYIETAKSGASAHARDARGRPSLSYNTVTGLVYIVERELSQSAGAPLASLLAWDPVHQKRAWEVRLNSDRSAGTLTTSGNLVFEGHTDGVLYAYDATEGKVVWKYNLGLEIAAPPISYCVNGLQYVAVLAGGGGDYAKREGASGAQLASKHKLQSRWLVALSLQGRATLPTLPPAQPAPASR